MAEIDHFALMNFRWRRARSCFATFSKRQDPCRIVFPLGRRHSPELSVLDASEGKVVTLELALNRCREANGESHFAMSATPRPRRPLMAFTLAQAARRQIPDDPARSAHQNGKRYLAKARQPILQPPVTCSTRRAEACRGARARA
jgi:sulfur-oxidizing protein SoxA